MREMQIKSTINDVDDKEDHDQLVNEDEDNLGNVLIEGKINNFKIKIIKQFYYFEEHFIINILLKLFFGVIILALPFICIIIFNIINFSGKSNFFFFPYFITLSLMIGFLMILLVIKIGENCQMNGIIIYTWERKNIFKIINSIIIGFYLLWFTFICEKFTNVYNLLKEKVAQSSNKETSTQLFNRGSYTLRILFILFFWDTEKDNDKEYIHKYLDYFEYEESVLSEFHSYIQSLILPIIFISFHYIFKIIFFKSRKEFLFFILNIIVVFQSFFIIFYPIEKKEDDNALKDEYFSNVGCKYIELIAYLLIILILIIISFEEYIIKLIRKKYYPKKGNKKITIIIIISSFMINFIGYILIIILLLFFSFDKIDEKMKIEEYQYYWIFIYLSITLILIGYSFLFGHYCYNLIYYPISYEITPHALKNNFYTKCSGKIIESEVNTNFKFSKKSFDGFIMS